MPTPKWPGDHSEKHSKAAKLGWERREHKKVVAGGSKQHTTRIPPKRAAAGKGKPAMDAMVKDYVRLGPANFGRMRGDKAKAQVEREIRAGQVEYLQQQKAELVKEREKNQAELHKVTQRFNRMEEGGANGAQLRPVETRQRNLKNEGMSLTRKIDRLEEQIKDVKRGR